MNELGNLYRLTLPLRRFSSSKLDLAAEIAEVLLALDKASIIDDAIYIDDPTCYPAILLLGQRLDLLQ